MKKVFMRFMRRMKSDNEKDARFSMLEELFYDFHRNRVEIYKVNFIRGIFFGLGSVLGGTVVVALVVWVLSFFVTIPGIGQPIQSVQDVINSRER